VKDEEIEKRFRRLNGGLGLLWVVVLFTVVLLIKAGAFSGLFK
jgi:hypothetical protein